MFTLDVSFFSCFLGGFFKVYFFFFPPFLGFTFIGHIGNKHSMYLPLVKIKKK